MQTHTRTHDDVGIDAFGFSIQYGINFTEARRLLRTAEREGLARSVSSNGITRYIFDDGATIGRQTNGRPSAWIIKRGY